MHGSTEVASSTASDLHHLTSYLLAQDVRIHRTSLLFGWEIIGVRTVNNRIIDPLSRCSTWTHTGQTLSSMWQTSAMLRTLSPGLVFMDVGGSQRNSSNLVNLLKEAQDLDSAGPRRHAILATASVQTCQLQHLRIEASGSSTSSM